MKKFLTRKLLPILSIFLLVINIFSILSFASNVINIDGTDVINIDGTDVIISDKILNNYSYFFIAKLTKTNNYMLAVGNSPFLFYTTSDGTRYIETTNFNCSGGSLSQISNYYFSSVSNISKYNLNDFTTSSLEFKYSNCDITDNSSSVIYPSDAFQKPSFINTKDELGSGKFNSLKINAGDLGYNDELGLAIFDATSNLIQVEDAIMPNLKAVKSFVLNSKSDYFRSSDLHIYYDIPQSSLQLDISNGKKYMFCLVNLDDYTLYNSIIFTVGGMTSEEEIKNAQDVTNDKLDEQTNAIRDQTEAMKEQTETNKNIFEKIGDILSYINPFSENFFVYKLIELLIDAIKSLFIPSDDFFSNYFNELKDWFSDRLGFLFYPFEVVIDILTKILSVNFNEPVFNVPDINEPFSGSKLISATSFNLNDLVSDGAFKVIHDIYLVCLDAFIVFELVNLFKRKYEEVTTK